MRTLGSPVVERAELFGHGQGDEVAEAKEGEDDAEKGERWAGRVEATCWGL